MENAPGVSHRRLERDNQFMNPLSMQRTEGFTRVELVVVVAVIAVLLSMLLPAMNKSKAKADRFGCIDNLHHIGMAYRAWAGDHGDRFPASTSITNGGWAECLKNPNQGPLCWTNYVIMANELAQATMTLVCPADQRTSASLSGIGSVSNTPVSGGLNDNTHLSYFVPTDASDSKPTTILGGDRNLGPGTVPNDDYGYSPANGLGNDVVINGTVCWSLKMHSAMNTSGAGNILLADGSQQTMSSAFFNSFVTNAPNPPITPPGIRLIFP
jgi:type II secretory pathway pseudopilin PulG